jgi:hypothetical protein
VGKWEAADVEACVAKTVIEYHENGDVTASEFEFSGIYAAEIADRFNQWGVVAYSVPLPLYGMTYA